MNARRTTQDAAFLNSVVRTEDGCLHWTGAVEREGYGRFREDGRLIMAHRYSWKRENGPIEPGKVLDHYLGCGHTCCEVTHLRVVTDRENSRHRVKMNRNNTSGYRGVSWNRAKGCWQAAIYPDGKVVRLGSSPAYELHVAGWRALNARLQHYGPQYTGLV